MLRFEKGVLGVVSCLLVASAGARAATSPQDTSTEAKPRTSATAESDSSGLEEIVVTGSRLNGGPGFVAPTPVTSVTMQDMQAAMPSNIPDALNRLPQFSNSQSDRTYFNSNSQLPFNGNYLNLRGIGPERSLVLLDGRRVPPTSYTGAVDANTLPQMLVERVDVVTAGASAAYGSDAVSGVVNYVLNRKVDGIRVDVQGGISSRSDSQSEKFGVAGGTSLFGGNVHVEGSAEHFHRNGLPYQGARRWGADSYLSVGSGTAADPFRLAANTRFGFLSTGGFILNGPLAGQQFLPDGTVAPFAHGLVTPGGIEIGGDGVALTTNSLVSAIQTDQVFGRLDWHVSNSLNAFAQASWARSVNDYFEIADYRFGNITIFNDNAFLQPSVASSAFAPGSNSFSMYRADEDLGRQPTHTTNGSLNVTAGLEGAFGEDWKWSTALTYGRSDLNTRVYEVENQRFYAALDAVVDPATGNIVCNVDLTNPGLYPGCVPLNVMGNGAPSKAAVDWVHGYSRYNVINDMTDFSADLRGSPVHTWAGPVAMAVGAEIRRQTLEQTSNADPAFPVDFTGIRAGGGNKFSFTNVGTASGSYDIKEAFTEVQVPLAKAKLMANDLQLNGAVREIDYSTVGRATPWKLGVIWEPVGGVRFRATRSRDIRAPTLYNLYSSRSVNPIGLIDPEFPQLGVQGVQTAQQGNPNLKPERSITNSVGVVFQPHGTGLQASIDYFDLKLTDVISNSNAYAAPLDCYNSGGTSPECAAVIRDPATHRIIEIEITPLNLSMFEVKGIDTDLSWQTQFGQGDLTIRSLASYLDSYAFKAGPTSTIVESAGTANGVGTPGPSGLPRWRGTFSLNYKTGDLGIYLGERWTGGFRKSNLPTAVYAAGYDHVPSWFYTDLTVTYDVKFGKSSNQVYLTVNDLFDRQAPLVPGTQLPGLIYPTLLQIYDIMGTYVTAGVRVRL